MGLKDGGNRDEIDVFPFDERSEAQSTTYGEEVRNKRGWRETGSLQLAAL